MEPVVCEAGPKPIDHPISELGTSDQQSYQTICDLNKSEAGQFSGLKDEIEKGKNSFPSSAENHSALCLNSDFSLEPLQEENSAKINCMQSILSHHVIPTDPSPDNCDLSMGYSDDNDSETCDSSSLSDLISEYNQRNQDNCDSESQNEVKKSTHPLASLFGSENNNVVDECRKNNSELTSNGLMENHPLSASKVLCKFDNSVTEMDECSDSVSSPKLDSRTSPNTIDSTSRESSKTLNSELVDQALEEPTLESSNCDVESNCDIDTNKNDEPSPSPSNDNNQSQTSDVVDNEREKSQASSTSNSEKTENKNLSDEQKKKKRKENLKKRKSAFDDEDLKDKKSKTTNHRKNIRDIMEDENLDIGTREAQLQELERVKRVQEAQQRALLEHQKREENQIRELIEKSNEISDSLKPGISACDKEDVICLDSGEENEVDEVTGVDKDIIVSKAKIIAPKLEKSSSDVIDVSSEEEGSDLLTSKTFNLLRSAENAVKSDEKDDEEEEEDDPDNSGCHTNDNLNQPDEFGRVLVNVGHPEDEEDIFIAPQLAGIIKPHQIGGIRFLYDNIIESIKGYDKSSGFGCILAHSMGLGKTLQVITFCDIFLRHTSGRKVIIVAPINTIQNWVSEFEMWTPSANTAANQPEFRPRNYQVFTLLDNVHKNITARHALTKSWSIKGGVLLMGYEMYRLLTIKNLRKLQAKRGRKKMDEVVDIEEEDRNKELLTDIYSFICDPGPDLIVCDEGHRIKNNQAGVSQALKNIKTKRRVVLTGYPLQNNLIEYWCMVDFSRPNYLGSKAEFCNMFERPIMNGQCVDSTDNDKRLMKFRSHVLHSLLNGFVQRRSHSVLKYSLPKKEEHVLMIRLTPLQRALYTTFMEELKSRKSIANPLKAFAVCIKICNHLDILYRLLRNKKLYDNDLDLDESSAGGATKKRRGKSNLHVTANANTNMNSGINLNSNMNVNMNMNSMMGMNSNMNVNRFPSMGMHPNQNMNVNANMNLPSGMNMNSNMVAASMNMNHHGMNMNPGMNINPNMNANNDFGRMQGGVVPQEMPGVHQEIPGVPQEVPITQYPPKDKDTLGYDWAMQNMKNYQPGRIENGCKMVVLFAIIEHTLKCGERLLVFSQSLYTLDLIEEFLQKSCIPQRPNIVDAPGERWMRNYSYFRLDGSTSAQEREKLINSFNKNEKIGIFMLSTRAGCLGINLVGANRVVIYDASWNPCHDAQAVCRVYRYGQRRPIHVYRLVMDNTLEKKIYERQVRKRGMSDRVVDELNPEAKFTTHEMSTLLNTDEEEPLPQDLKPFSSSFDDTVLSSLCNLFSQEISQKPFEHESLLLSRTEEKLTKYEKKLAKQSYEFEKRYSSFNKSAYTTVYTTQGGTTVLSGTPARIYNNVRFAQPMNILNQQTPMQSTPLPMRPFHANSGGSAAEFTKQGVTVQRITINKELSITASKPGVPPIVIPTGKQVLVLRTVKGVYLRTPDGKVISVKLPQNKQAGAQSGISGANAATTSSTTVPAAANGSKEVIDISDDDESHASTSQAFAFSGNKYNVNSMMHTSGGAVLQKKAVGNLPASGGTMWKGSVNLNQNKTPTTAIVTKTQIKDLSRAGGISILTTSASSQPKVSLNTSLRGLSNVTCTPVKPKIMKTMPESKVLSSKNVVTISKVLAENKPNMIKLKTCTSGIGAPTQSKPFMASSPSLASTSATFLRNIKSVDKIPVPIRDQILPADETKTTANLGNPSESSAFSELSNFVNKSSLMNTKPTALMPNVMSSVVGQKFSHMEQPPSAGQLSSPGSDQRMNRMNDLFHQNTENCQPNVNNINQMASKVQAMPGSDVAEMALGDLPAVDSEDKNLKQAMPNLFDAGLNVDSFMSPATSVNDFMTNYATSSTNVNPYMAKDMFTASGGSSTLRQTDVVEPPKNVGSNNTENLMTNTATTNSNFSNQTTTASGSTDAHSSQYNYGTDNNSYSGGYSESSSFYQPASHATPTTNSMPSNYNSRPNDSNFFYNHYHPSSHWDPMSLPHPTNSYSSQSMMPSLPVPATSQKLLPTSVDPPSYPHMPQATNMTPTSHHDNAYPWMSSASKQHTQSATNNPYPFLSQSSSDYLGYNYYNQGLGQSSHYPPYYSTQMGLAPDQFGTPMPMYHHSFARPQQQGSSASVTNVFQPTDSGVQPTSSSAPSSSSSYMTPS